MEDQQIHGISEQFELPGPIASWTSFGSGHIHDTYLISCNDRYHNSYILQKFNHQVFSKPELVMENIAKVMAHLKTTSQSEPGSELCIIPTKTGKSFWCESPKTYWRVFNYVEDSVTLDRIEKSSQAYEGGLAFGTFLYRLKDMDVQSLQPTITDFHHIGQRFQKLQDAVANDTLGRAITNLEEISFALDRKPQVDFLTNLIDSQSLPLRVTHNDTKINNVLFHRQTSKGICVIDLDTVMPGYLMYDFGDMTRTFCNPSSEADPTNLVGFEMDVFKALCEGFLTKIKAMLTAEETQSLGYGPWFMTYIMGIRFLTDFLEGDIYYKINYPMHNLDRVKNQFKLVSEIEKKQIQINTIIGKCLSDYS